MVANQTECSRLEKRSVMKFLRAKKCKPCEIYRIFMCTVKRIFVKNVYKEACFFKTVYKWVKHGFATTNFSQKDRPRSENPLTLL